MSTDRVRTGSSIAEWIRGHSVAAAKSGRKVASQQGAVSAGRADMRDPAALRHDLALLAAGVDLDSEPAVRALRRPVVRRILMWEFGESFVEHPDFHDMVANIESAMDADSDVPARFLSMLRQLRDERTA